MGWIECVHCENLWCDFVARASSSIALVQPVLHRVSCYETLPNAPKHYEMLQNMSLDPMGWIECVLCEKFRCVFMAQTCALIVPVQPVLHWVSCGNETLTNAPKHYENTPNTSLGSNGMDRVRSLPKIRCDFVPRTFAFMFNPFCTKFCVVTKQIQNAPKQYETHQYYSLGSNGADRVCLLQKIAMRLHDTNLCLNCTSWTHFAPSSV